MTRLEEIMHGGDHGAGLDHGPWRDQDTQH